MLKRIEKKADTEGIVELSKLISPDHDIRDARELDVYANTERFPKPRARVRVTDSAEAFKDIGLKPEIDSLAKIAAKRTIIKKVHNKLINRLNDYLLWRQVGLRVPNRPVDHSIVVFAFLVS